jgi:DNA end-binding protein Ku
MLSTMLFADEVRPSKDVDTASQKSHKPPAQQLKAAVAVIDELAGKWEPSDWKDRYRRRLQDVVSRKRKGKTVKAPEPREPEPSQSPDLMAALEQTLAEMRGSEKRQKQEA